MEKEKIVYIVHCVDTEGPLCESIEATFKRVKESFNEEFEPSFETLEKLQKKQIKLNGKEEAIFDFVRSDQLNCNDSWDKIYNMHNRLFSEEFRRQFPDSHNNGYRFSWFCLDHVGYRDNPRRRTMGFHAIFEEYKRILGKFNCADDAIYFHYHAMNFAQDAHRSGSNFNYLNIADEILTRRIIDHMWFPVAHRPSYTEHIDSNLWLEQWIPFDYANQNMADNEGLKKHERFGRVPGRFGDWRGAPTEWGIYHPSVCDSRKPGNLRRYIARCLNLNCRHSKITGLELEKAFLTAAEGGSVLVSVTNHDFRDMISETKNFIDMVRSVSKKYKQVKFIWANAVQAFRAVAGMENQPPPRINCRIDGNILKVKSDRPLWGVQPFLAIRTKEGNYYHDNLIINNELDWTYAFDSDSFLLEMVSKIGIATNDPVGNTVVAVCDLSNSKDWKITQLNTQDWIK